MGYKTYTCPIARRCGGCEWLAVPYPIQLRRKAEQVRELFGAMVSEDGGRIADVAGMEDPRGYRHKAATPFAPGPRGMVRCGFYEAGTHRIVFGEQCLAEEASLRGVLVDVARTAERLRISAYDEDRQRGVLRHAVARTGLRTNETLLTLVTNGQQLPREQDLVGELVSRHPELVGIVQNVNQRRTNAILGPTSRTLYGSPVMRDVLLGCTFQIGATSFYQTNPAQTERLYRLAIEGARLARGERVLDAYCGTGTIGICAASQVEGLEVVGVEQVGAAVELARVNAAANGLAERCTFVKDDATAFMHRERQRGTSTYDVVIMDPPRAGSTPEFLHGVAALGPRRVAYVSCNAVTQARDLAVLRGRGYCLELLTPVDMFPHTKHMETVAVLSRER